MAKKTGNIIYDNYCRFTGVYVTTTIITTKPDGTPYTDADVDNCFIFKNKPRFGGYSMRNHDGYIKASWFGVKGDAIINTSTGAFISGTDNTQAILNIIKCCVTNNITSVEFPTGIMMVNTDPISDHTFRISNPLRFFGKGMGGRHFRDIVTTKVTAFFDNSSLSTTESLFTFDGTSTALYNPLPCTEFYDIAIVGQGQTRCAVTMFRTGWETNWDRVSFDYFKGGAIFFDSSFDTNMNNITITRCGGLLSGVPHYAITESSTVGDISNAHHFNNLHIEFCRYYINFDICRNIYISNFKFEQFGNSGALPYMNGVDTDLVNPMIRFGQGALEVALQCGMIITRQIDEWLAVNSGHVAADIPYNIISYATALDSRRIHKFVNVDFTSPDNGTAGPVTMGSRILDTGDFGKFVILGCSLNNLSGYANPIRLKNSKISECKAIYIRRGTADISGITTEHSEITNNEIFSINTVGSPDGTAIEFLDAGSPASKVTGNIINTYLKKYKQTGGASNQSAYTRSLLSITLSDAAYMLQMGLSSINFSNVVIDLARIDASFIKLQLSANATIKTVLNGFRGEQITFLDDSATSIFTFGTGGTSSFSIDVQSVGSIKPAQAKTFIYSSFVWLNPTTAPIVGTSTFTGSSQTTINIPHGLGVVPGFTNVIPKSATARAGGITSWTEDATNIIITVTTPQASGSMTYTWEAKY